jgi:hypothetical protein
MNMKRLLTTTLLLASVLFGAVTGHLYAQKDAGDDHKHSRAQSPLRRLVAQFQGSAVTTNLQFRNNEGGGVPWPPIGLAARC